MTHLPELRAALMDAAHRQHAAARTGERERGLRTAQRRAERGWRAILGGRTLHGGRAALASVVLGLAGPAAGAVQVGAPLGPEPRPPANLAKPVGAAASAPTSVGQRP